LPSLEQKLPNMSSICLMWRHLIPGRVACMQCRNPPSETTDTTFTTPHRCIKSSQPTMWVHATFQSYLCMSAPPAFVQHLHLPVGVCETHPNVNTTTFSFTWPNDGLDTPCSRAQLETHQPGIPLLPPPEPPPEGGSHLKKKRLTNTISLSIGKLPTMPLQPNYCLSTRFSSLCYIRLDVVL